jgi:AcrR family transcriptional regulator
MLVRAQTRPVITATVRRTQAQRSATTRARLLDATIESLVERGWAGTSTTEVVRRAGVSRGAQVHHFPTKEDLVLAAVAHLLERRTREFEAAFADLPAAQRSPATAMRLLWEHCFRDSFAAWLELLVAARTDPALHARFVELEAGFFDGAVATFRGLFAEASADPTFARVALKLAFGVLDGMAIGRMLDAPDAELDVVLDAFNAITAPYFPHSGGTSP